MLFVSVSQSEVAEKYVSVVQGCKIIVGCAVRMTDGFLVEMVFHQVSALTHDNKKVYRWNKTFFIYPPIQWVAPFEFLNHR